MILKVFFIYCVVWGLAQSTDNDTYRLPTNIIPEHYTLDVITNFDDDFKFNGHVQIETKCVESTDQINLHMKNLTIDEDTISIKDITTNNPVKIDVIEEDEEKEWMIIHTKEPLEDGKKYLISIKFEGRLSNSLSGYYRSQYETKNGEKRWLSVTQFEPTYARKAFPCFDEPSMKATFKISLGRKDGYIALSNMPLEATKPIIGMPGWYWDIFQKSVPMSTYLVAYTISDFGHVMSPLKDLGNNVTFNIWARKDALDQVDFANSVGPRALAFYEEFYDLPYPLPKQDMIAIPDFSAGAMENWGLITYRETALLYDKDSSTTQSRHRVASVIAHELAHQWFGNLVTMKWWTDLWLNEGFATYMAALAIDHLYPEWNSLEESIVDGAISVFYIDALKSSHPVSVKIDNPDLISEIFDTVSYEKGSFLIRMMGLFLGEESLKEGVNSFLKEHKFGNADQDDLWKSLTTAAHKNKAMSPDMTVNTVMDSWTLQTGYPVVTVTRNYKDGTATLTQERFFRDTIRARNGSAETCWWIPVSYTTEREMDVNTTTPKTWMTCPLKETTITGLPSDGWLLLNLQLASLYKINYDEQNWNLLSSTLRSEDLENIPVLNRVQIIDDASEFAWVGLIKYQLLFDILGYLKNETQYSPWLTAIENLNVLDIQTMQYPTHDLFKKYMRNLLYPQFEKFGMRISTESERLDTVSHQEMIIRKSCMYGISGCLQEAKQLFSKYQNSSETENPIPKDIRRSVYCYGVKEGGENEWNFLWNRYKKANLASEKNLLMRALGCTKNTELLRRYLELTIQENSGIKRQDASTVFAAVLTNSRGFEIAKNFLYTSFNAIYDYNEGDSNIFNRYLKPLAKYMTKPEDYQEFKNFLSTNEDKLSEINQSIKQAVETVQLNMQWQAKYQDEIQRILEVLTTDYKV
ncbi:aminopeptidase N-like [Coccinella septempunctata]|uniref:aminopeptidase N-like n=1 Tax=Coccinella septempunctata TaxID=41139 RepID=UPI001D06715E|nr:aminopeptidase N-like [Coccinella septempunctata]